MKGCNQMIKVSVIIPCYNAEYVLESCLDSVLSQTLKDIEVICVDDGSTDNTLNILHKYASLDSRLSVITQQNQYAGVARNNGMAQATGKYFSFLDSDDFFEPTMLKKMYEKCEQDNADICICDSGIYEMSTNRVLYDIYQLQRYLLPEFIPFSREDAPDDIMTLCNPAPWNKMFRSDFIREHGLQFQALKRSNDVFFSEAAMVMAKRITICDQWFITRRRGSSTSLTETMGDDPFCFYYSNKAVKDFLIEKGLYEKYKISFLKRTLSSGLHALRMTKTKEAWLEVAIFLKEKNIPEFELWENRKLLTWRNGVTKMTFLVKNSKEKLAEYEPELRKDETNTLTQDPAWEFLLEENTLKVSVIIYVSNSEEHIEETLIAVMRQTLCDIEILCIDDDSTDRSLEIMERLSQNDSRIRIIHQSNQGIADGLNIGLCNACGEYVMFLNSGDVLIWSALERLYKKSKYYDLDDLFCEAIVFFEPFDLYSKHKNYHKMYRFNNKYIKPVSGQDLLTTMLRKKDSFNLINIRLFKRSFLQENNITFSKADTAYSEIFSLRTLNAASRTWVHNEPLYLKRFGHESVSLEEKSWTDVYRYYLCLVEVEKMISLELMQDNTDFKRTLEKLKNQYKRLLLKTYWSIPGKRWATLHEESMEWEHSQLPGTLSMTIRMLQQESALLKKERDLNDIYNSNSWKLARTLSLPSRSVQKCGQLIKNTLKPVVKKSNILTSLYLKIYNKK